jgi:hypothetical protein
MPFLRCFSALPRGVNARHGFVHSNPSAVTASTNVQTTPGSRSKINCNPAAMVRTDPSIPLSVMFAAMVMELDRLSASLANPSTS